MTYVVFTPKPIPADAQGNLLSLPTEPAAFVFRDENRSLTPMNGLDAEMIPVEVYRIVNHLSARPYGKTPYAFEDIVHEIQRQFPELFAYREDSRGFALLPPPPDRLEAVYAFDVRITVRSPVDDDEYEVLEQVRSLFQELAQRRAYRNGLKMEIESITGTDARAVMEIRRKAMENAVNQ